MRAFILKPDHTVRNVRVRGRHFFTAENGIYAVDPQCVWLLENKKLRVPISVYQLGNPNPFGSARGIKEIAKRIWHIRTLSQLSLPAVRLPGKAVVGFLFGLAILALMFTL